jgi:hypothetical protein
MRPDTTIPMHHISSPHTLEGFAKAGSDAVAKVLAFRGNPSDTYVHMGNGPLTVTPTDPKFLGDLRQDLEKHGKAIITVKWGPSEDDWEMLCICGAEEPGKGPSIVVLWFGQDLRPTVKKGSAKLMASNWDGTTETVAGILGGPERSPN